MKNEEFVTIYKTKTFLHCNFGDIEFFQYKSLITFSLFFERYILVS
ncbi:hypothetical protein QFZ72_005398 [Bacillus sp. V2I10]|nr:hypothetical protein [Bacillus sp. V2I10]